MCYTSKYAQYQGDKKSKYRNKWLLQKSEVVICWAGIIINYRCSYNILFEEMIKQAHIFIFCLFMYVVWTLCFTLRNFLNNEIMLDK